ncbi:2-amino-4-hydroxy-6-hydroxymethyldihydropteridine diphosphokinase [Francisella frigiditurris]|uniref:2-amino-4-hydroxy-6-hydroxymethyldihydropteridine diphosphokinase n=1 Tax=Francisella frigiditurris TaxID=1542390 RepID=A0A1J0KRJ0_9GAMM|nr:2-amino-4-hydroxy-6-hydroxymethyldihydropteridine diphosphokinase [Francisella frigiditurris]APC96381.1 2-amino-4-hydroxy-6-hydroxymethyldihydropteridine diphosphokinase [Francisella frigiditurris]
MQYIIGIGANIGDTLINIRTAIETIEQSQNIKIFKKSSLYSSDALLKDDAPEDWDIKYLNAAIEIETDLEPLELLDYLKQVEQIIGRNLNAPVWSPRVIDLDILAADDFVLKTHRLTIPHKELLNRSFALLPLLEIKNDWQHLEYLELDLNKHILTLSRLEKLKQRISGTIRMGICNLSSQSFSDGHLTDSQRLENFYQLIDDGAEIIDFGAESTKLEATEVNIDNEFDKLDEFLSLIKQNIRNLKYRPLISIDTRKTEVIRKILEKHHDIIWMINDVECDDIDGKAKLIAKYDKKYVMTHNLGIINRDKYLDKDNAITQVIDFFLTKKQSLIKAGVREENIYFDLGFGFSKKAEVAQLLLNSINEIQKILKLKSLIGHSRKPSILNLPKSSSIEDLDQATKKLTAILEQQSINIVRVHKI